MRALLICVAWLTCAAVPMGLNDPAHFPSAEVRQLYNGGSARQN